MKLTALFSVLAALVVSLGCATDPNKQVIAADADRAADRRENQEDKSRLEAEQKKEHAELDATHARQDGDMVKQKADDASKSTADHVTAEANVVAARKSYRAAATARLEQVEAKAVVLEKSAKKAQQPLVAALRSNHARAKAAVKSLDDATDAAWFDSKTIVEASLVTLEKDLHDLEAKL